jgi:hypothetical protein
MLDVDDQSIEAGGEAAATAVEQPLAGLQAPLPRPGHLRNHHRISDTIAETTSPVVSGK